MRIFALYQKGHSEPFAPSEISEKPTTRNSALNNSLEMRAFPLFFTLCSFLVSAGCGDTEFRSARKAEKLGRYPTAIEEYEKFFQKDTANPKSAEALFRIGEIYRTVLKDYVRARLYFEKVSTQYKQSPWSLQAEIGYMNSPDYFPLVSGFKRRIGDSASGGNHMQMEESFHPIKESALRLKMERQIYAGETQVGKKEYLYEKKDRELREFSPGNEQYSVILRYPPEQNLKWETLREGKRVVFTIESDRQTIEIKAGIFTNCLKVKNQFVDTKHSWRYDYYAPEAGLILMSVATAQGETRISELLSIGSEKKEMAQTTQTNKWKKWLEKTKKMFKKAEQK